MPLYTYVAVYKDSSYIAQKRRSNYQGFSDWIEALPAGLQKKAAPSMYAGFEPVPNRKNVWRRTQTIDDSELVVIAIQTDS
ncbi:hypothetical protein [Bradyrhizobium sp. CCBAU 51753]|uniref:hypothetical protein n=1 Tax=Bradyrhizobium sp. CCBAU 51753 TaxID=1325100 RepID=UPI00188B4AF5|nr:hypothetical protein [Bradyrhizobium sp. CCBAU 51753]QOZ29846.1 hypothetical protein XH93_21685 [Bradyrhizobium sp. CCBAU 51753]